MFTATGSATYSATSSGTGSGSGTTLTDAINAANSAALSAARNGISTVPNTFVSSTSLLLLQPTVYPADLPIEKTFNYYWDSYSNLFGRIQIVYTDIDEDGEIITDNAKIIEKNIKYLNMYYNKGYRLFMGFSVSSILAGVLPWFETVGIEAKGISLKSNANSLSFPKPIDIMYLFWL